MTNMKYFICSDIHGSEPACKKLIEQFNEHKCDKMLILGDILYHGPRNQLPLGYNPKEVISLLNPIANKIIACRGNCDAEVDQMVLQFSCMADFVEIVDNGVTIFCTHGHVYAPVLSDGKKPTGCETASKKTLVNAPGIVFYGHTHVSVLEKKSDGIVVCNPGSPSIPKNGTEPGFALFENGTVQLFNLDGKVLKTEKISL